MGGAGGKKKKDTVTFNKGTVRILRVTEKYEVIDLNVHEMSHEGKMGRGKDTRIRVGEGEGCGGVFCLFLFCLFVCLYTLKNEPY